MSVKKLSPSEPVIVVMLEFYIRQSIPVSKVAKYLEKEYGVKPRFTPFHKLELKLHGRLDELDKLINRVKNLVLDIHGYLIQICSEVYCIVKEDICDTISKTNKCLKYRNHIRKILLCKTPSPNIYSYIICNTAKKYSSIRMIKASNKPTDPLIIPKSLFRICSDTVSVITFIEERIEHIYRMMTALSRDPPCSERG